MVPVASEDHHDGCVVHQREFVVTINCAGRGDRDACSDAGRPSTTNVKTVDHPVGHGATAASGARLLKSLSGGLGSIEGSEVLQAEPTRVDIE